MAHYFAKRRSLSDEELRTFVNHCKEDKRFSVLIKSFEIQIDNYQAAYNLSLLRSDLQTSQLSHNEDSAERELLNLLASAAEAQYGGRLNQEWEYKASNSCLQITELRRVVSELLHVKNVTF